MKAGWDALTLGDVVRLEYGKPLSREQRTLDGKYNVYGANGIKARSDMFYANGPSIIVGRKGSAGEINIADADFWPLDVTYFTVHNTERIDFGFLHYLLIMQNLPSMARGVKPGINRNDVYALKVFIPPLDEQKRIVAVLDAAFDGLSRACANVEANLQNTRELFERHLNLIFEKNLITFTPVKLGEISEVKGGKRLPKGEQLQSDDTGYPYIRVADFDGRGGVDQKKLRYLPKSVRDKIKRYTISSKDVFITIVGATIGKSGIVPVELEGANLTENACKLVLNDNVLNKYIYYFTLTESFYDQVGLNTRVAAQPKLALIRLKTIELGLPNLEVQKNLSHELDNMMIDVCLLQENYQSKLADLDELRQSLLEKAFAGELT